MKSSSSTRKKRKAPKSQTPSKDPNQEMQKVEENGNNHDLIDLPPYIPMPIITEILSRTRIKTLFNCRLVCKSWSALISTPEFEQLHLSRSPTSCLIKPIYKIRQTKRLHLIDLECPYSLNDKLVFIPKINLPNATLWLVNSCNGLVCLSSFDSSKIFVCNPVLKQYITLPNPQNVSMKSNIYYACAFGFSRITNQYKVIMGSYDYNGNYRAQIYRLGEGSWSSIEGVAYNIVNNNFNAFFNGAIHWIGFHGRCPLICCFDFASEEFRPVPEPYEFDELESYCSDQMCVGVINGNLSLCDFNYYVGGGVMIWVMKDYGVKESWSKDFVINHTINDTSRGTYEPIMVNRNGEILVIINNCCIMIYNPKSEEFESRVKPVGVSSKFQAIAHVPSLISLKDVAKGENLEVLGGD